MIDKIRNYLNYRYVLKHGINSVRQIEDDTKSVFYQKKYGIDFEKELLSINSIINSIDDSYKQNILYKTMRKEDDVEYRRLDMDFKLLDMDRK